MTDADLLTFERYVIVSCVFKNDHTFLSCSFQLGFLSVGVLDQLKSVGWIHSWCKQDRH